MSDPSTRAVSQHVAHRRKRDSLNYNSPARDGRLNTAGSPQNSSRRPSNCNDVVLIQHLLKEKLPSPQNAAEIVSQGSNNDDSILGSRIAGTTHILTHRREGSPSQEKYADDGALSTIRHTTQLADSTTKQSPSLVIPRSNHRRWESNPRNADDASKRTLQFHVFATQMHMHVKKRETSKPVSQRTST